MENLTKINITKSNIMSISDENVAIETEPKVFNITKIYKALTRATNDHKALQKKFGETGIVIARLQKDGVIRYDDEEFNSLKHTFTVEQDTSICIAPFDVDIKAALG